MNKSAEKFANLYVHFPFCESKCHYCDFFSLPEGQIPEKGRNGVYTALREEVGMWEGSFANPLSTVFLGGGTPSLVPLESLAETLALLPIAPGTESTIEANPSSIDREKAEAWLRAGINRVSMGVQALDDERLAWLGRVHSKAEVFRALDALFEAGFKNVSIDYILGVPGQTIERIRSELAEVLDRYEGIRHLSAYLLTLKSSNAKYIALPGEEEQLRHLRTAAGFLAERGFEQYEISNFARSGARARHNENYWLGGAYLGLGPSAHSYFPLTATRTKNWASLGKYRELVEQGQLPVEWSEQLTPEQERLEYLMLRTRRTEGLDLKEYEGRFRDDLWSRRQSVVEAWEADGLCRISYMQGQARRISFTPDGFFLSDQLVTRLV